jgi:hypothetical protein
MLIGGPHNTYAAHNKDPAHFSLNSIPAPGKMHLSRERFSAQNGHCPLLFQKRTIEDFAVSKMRVTRDARRVLRPRWIAER